MKYSVHVKLHKDFIEVREDTIVVGVRAKPQQGKANSELKGKIARHFGVPVSSVRILLGRTSRRKIIEIK